MSGENFLLSPAVHSNLEIPPERSQLKGHDMSDFKMSRHATVALVSLSFFLFVLLANITGINIALPKSSFGTGH